MPRDGQPSDHVPISADLAFRHDEGAAAPAVAAGGAAAAAAARRGADGCLEARQWAHNRTAFLCSANFVHLIPSVIWFS